jgi:hypothetical protein
MVNVNEDLIMKRVTPTEKIARVLRKTDKTLEIKYTDRMKFLKYYTQRTCQRTDYRTGSDAGRVSDEGVDTTSTRN